MRTYERVLQHKAEERAVAGNFHIGAVPSVMTGIMPNALIALRSKHPRVHVELAMGLSADLGAVVRSKLPLSVICGRLVLASNGRCLLVNFSCSTRR